VSVSATDTTPLDLGGTVSTPGANVSVNDGDEMIGVAISSARLPSLWNSIWSTSVRCVGASSSIARPKSRCVFDMRSVGVRDSCRFQRICDGWRASSSFTTATW
jgi:hypothetical protein